MLNPLRWVVEGVFVAQRHPLRFHTPCNPLVGRTGWLVSSSYRIVDSLWAIGYRAVASAMRVSVLKHRGEHRYTINTRAFTPNATSRGHPHEGIGTIGLR